jgi:hypothetical protein
MVGWTFDRLETGFLRDKKGYSLVWTAAVMALLFIPILALTVGVGRWFVCKGELQKAADLAALAAAQEVDVVHFRDTGEVVLLPSAYSVASRYASFNSDYLHARGVGPRLINAWVDQADHTVRVQLVADISSLFPQDLPDIVIQSEGTAEVRGLHR